MSLSTRNEVYRRTAGKCACGCGGDIAPGAIGYHHLLPKSKWPEFADEPANIVGVTAKCHAEHESATRRLPARVAALPREYLRLDPRAIAYLERVYRQ